MPFKQLMCASLLFVGIQGCDKADPETAAGKDLELTGVEKELVAKSNDFGLRLYRTAIQNPETDNVLISPLSVQTALAMTYQGARAETRDAMASVLGFQGYDTDVVNAYFKKLIRDLPLLDPQTKLEVANSIWYRESFQVIPAFLDVNRQLFLSEVNALDFEDAQSVPRINQWAETKTHGKIEKIVDELEHNLVMLLLNAVYFKGGWEQQFDADRTIRGEFRHGIDTNSMLYADYMQMEHSFPVAEHAKFDAVRMPYGNKKYQMIALRPKDGTAVDELVEQLAQPGGWSDLVPETGFSVRKINLHFPKFKFSYSNKLNDELDALGMGLAFSNAADFTGINENGQLQISEVRHKSFIEVNEEGTEAAAVTSVGIELTSMPVIPVLKFDRPFLFAIQEASSGLILFLGQVNDPLSDQ